MFDVNISSIQSFNYKSLLFEGDCPFIVKKFKNDYGAHVHTHILMAILFTVTKIRVVMKKKTQQTSLHVNLVNPRRNACKHIEETRTD